SAGWDQTGGGTSARAIGGGGGRTARSSSNNVGIIMTHEDVGSNDAGSCDGGVCVGECALGGRAASAAWRRHHRLPARGPHDSGGAVPPLPQRRAPIRRPVTGLIRRR